MSEKRVLWIEGDYPTKEYQDCIYFLVFCKDKKTNECKTSICKFNKKQKKWSWSSLKNIFFTPEYLDGRTWKERYEITHYCPIHIPI
jgi:hypothetical protein